ncbi:MAG: serine/threonine protein kinase [Polyangiales bacterium]
MSEPVPTSFRSGPVSQPGHPQRIGHYRVLGVLGTGFTTHVYRAEAEGVGRTVVLKVLRSTAGRDSVFFRRFEREARLLASLRHPNLIELFDYDAGVAGERPPYMVLEHVGGATLREILERSPRLPPDEAAAIALEVARALAYAHQKSVIHRDVKPANILVGRALDARSQEGSEERADERIVVKVVDFGIAQEGSPEPGEGAREEGDAIGTPAYMSPEQLLGEALDHRADQFALGIVLYQMLAGVRPFDGDDGRPAIQRIRRDPPRPFKSLGLTVPKDLERIVLRCLAKRPQDRFARTDELVADLARFLEGRVEGLTDLSPFHRRVLARTGFLDERRGLREEEQSKAPASLRAAPIRVRAVPLTPTVIGIAIASLALFGGGAAIQIRQGGIKSEREATRPPPPVMADPSDTGRLRILVRPWADVVIDGRKIDTTPIGKPIALRPGKHVILLQHPSVTERRVVEIEKGQQVTLDVTLNVPAAAASDEFLPPPPMPSGSAPPPPKSSAPSVPSTLQNQP